MAEPAPVAAFQRHGGRLVAAAAAVPDAPVPWIDLSTGVNPRPYPAPRATLRARTYLPDPTESAALEKAAAAAFGVADPARVAAVPGSESVLRLLPRLLGVRSVAIAGPTYSSHAEAWRAAGAAVTIVPMAAVWNADAEALVIVNPNNPDGAATTRGAILEQAARRRVQNRWLIVDEAFVETAPHLSVAESVGPGLIVLRSFGKFYGLPGVRLGFMIADAGVIAMLGDLYGDWPVSADAIAAGLAAYPDRDWADRTRRRLARDVARLDRMLVAAGFAVVGGTSLFRLARCADACRRFTGLARAGILTRIFDHDPTLIRFGLPGRSDWARLESALQECAR